MIAKLQALLGMDSSKFTAETKKAGNSVNKFGKGLGNIKGLIAGAFSVGILINFGRKLLKTADDLQTASNIFKVSLETMIAFQSVMAESGINAEKFNKIFGRIASAQGDVRRGLKTYIDAIEDMNISQDEFVGIGVDDVLVLMAQKYEEAGDKGKFMEGTVKLLGTRLAGLVEVFQRMNREGMDPFISKAKEAADGMRSLAAASDALEKTGNTLTLWAAKAVGAVAKVGEVMGRASTARETGISSGELLYLELQAKIAAKIKEEGKARELATATEAAEKEKRLLEEKIQAEKKAAEIKKKTDDEDDARLEKRIKISEKYWKNVDKHEAQKKSILAGKGVSTPDMARADRLQSVGGVVGGVSGAGQQQARIAERQLETNKLILESVMEFKEDTKDIKRSLAELSEG